MPDLESNPMKLPKLPQAVVLAAGLLANPGLPAADTAVSLAAERVDLLKNNAAAFVAVKDDPALPRVLLIGDSISIGYTPAVREMLAGVANVHRIPDNGGPTRRGLAQLDAWLGTGRWDVIHFNFGLHDLKRDDSDHVQVPIAEYEQNLRVLIARLRATKAKLVFATTTPVPGRTSNRRQEDVVAYNAVALRLMHEAGIPVDDLHAFALPRLAAIQRPANVHYTDAGYRELAGPVTEAIRVRLPHR